ncbi:diguanylate cyclase [Occallatibacter savannae]|uniref:ligand-binding sensor domain-containing diguanylate cyclase n=1 Tax=Occallatibacter savannae TaxID=1002691 RepID=UPI0013A57E1A|nr:diguanylate cyclase [Occallatibacter savannae]
MQNRRPNSVRFFAAAALAVAMLGSVCARVSAQRYSFRQYTQGLGNLNITAIQQDRTGYLWVGTQNGLYRYDGSQFQRFGASQGMPDRIIDNLYVSQDGTLWVGTTAGVYFERKDGQFAQVKLPVPLNEFTHPTGTTFASGKNDEVVTVSTSHGVVLRKRGPDDWTAEPLNLQGAFIWSVLYGPDGSLWYGCDKELCRLKDGHTTLMRTVLGLPEEQWLTMMVARDGNIWMRSNQHILELSPDGSRADMRDLPGKPVAESYPLLAEDSQGRILTSQLSSIALWEKDHWRFVTERNGISSFEVQGLFVDREGSIWMGVVGHGLERWVGEDSWEAYTEADGLQDNLIWSSIRDNQGRLWIGTETGLSFIPAGSNTAKAWHLPGTQISRAGSLELGPDGAIWLGSMAGSLTRIDAKNLSGRMMKMPAVYGLLADGPNRMWIATVTGLYAIDPSDANARPEPVVSSAFPKGSMRFTSMSKDLKGQLWATSDHGIFKLDTTGWHAIDAGGFGTRPDIIAADWKGNLWVAGPSQDLMKLRVDGTKVVSAEHIGHPPLMSEGIVALRVDRRGRLWVGEDAGVTVYDGQMWRSFTQDDGLIWNDTDSFAIYEDRDGSMWIGTSAGLSHLIKPENALAGSPPPPAISQVSFGLTEVTDGGSVKWSSNAPLTVSMALLSFKDTQDIGIRYRLVGEQDSAWENTRELTVHFRHLLPGNYRFEVEAVNAAGSSVSPRASFSFRIAPLWWQNVYLQRGLGVLCLVLAVWAWRRRVGQLMRQKRQLEEAVRDRTKDLEKEKTELVRTREQMRHFAEHDGLTGLWNHRIIVERLRGEVDRSMRDGSPLAVILADLDYFKQINDAMGHVYGDMTLRETAALFQKVVRSYDWVGRYGGEEFLLILPGSSIDAARDRAEQLRKILENAVIGEGDRKFSVTASFGVAAGFPTNYEEMIQIADAALYRAKNSGRNRVVATEIKPNVISISQAAG